ncbi:MAG: hypothetical protein KC613_06345 [Myxococcales bacterium]|nr:hypothetical protein [Myxococcales bacterium]
MRIAFLLAVTLLPAASALADDRWQRHAGDCDAVLRAWQAQALGDLERCVKRYEMYRPTNAIDDDERARMHAVLDKVYAEGDDRAKRIALGSMKRLGVRPRAIVNNEKGLRRAGTEVPVIGPAAGIGADPPPNATAGGVDALAVDPNAGPEVFGERPPDHNEAVRQYRVGVGHYKAGQIEQALGAFLASGDADPTWAKPLYLAAICYARMGQPVDAVATLKQMKNINSDLARQLVRRAGEDREFARLRKEPAFKSLTGAAVVQILNGGGDKGAEDVRKFVETLEGKGIPVARVGTDANSRVSDYLYAKPGFEKQAERIRRVLRLGLVHQRKITWPTPYDVILVHGLPQKGKWVDDEAEKSAKKAAADRKKAEAAAKKKEDAEAAAAREKAKADFENFKKFQEMQNNPTGQIPDGPKGPDDIMPPP